MVEQTEPAAAPADDRDTAQQWVLPLVVRVERATPPSRTDALEAAARAVLELLVDPRSVDGPWREAVRGWQDSRIRKVVRRARASAWQRVEHLDGLTVERGSAQVRVHPPVPVDAWPPDLARLQVGGTELDDPEPPGEPDPRWPVLYVNPAVRMSAGKQMAQAGHAAQLAWWASGPRERSRWRAAGFPLAVRPATPDRWRRLLRAGAPVVADGGFTEVAPGTRTVAADLPWPAG